MEEVVFVTCLCLKVITATHVFSLGGRECMRESPSFSDIERRVETYCLFSWLIQLQEWMWNSPSECLSSLLLLGKKLIVLNLLLRKSSFNGNIQRHKKKKLALRLTVILQCETTHNKWDLNSSFGGFCFVLFFNIMFSLQEKLISSAL